jgi:hypothetical protein
MEYSGSRDKMLTRLKRLRNDEKRDAAGFLVTLEVIEAMSCANLSALRASVF